MKPRSFALLLLCLYLAWLPWFFSSKPKAPIEIHYLHEVEIVTPASLPCVYRDIRV